VGRAGVSPFWSWREWRWAISNFSSSLPAIDLTVEQGGDSLSALAVQIKDLRKIEGDGYDP
jgi:hypothetical protein